MWRLKPVEMDDLQDTTMHQESQGFDPNDVALVTQPGQVSPHFRRARGSNASFLN